MESLERPDSDREDDRDRRECQQASNTTLRGLVLGAGLDVKALFLHIQPEIRFTRWGAKKYFDPGDFFGRNQNQAEFLLGISF